MVTLVFIFDPRSDQISIKRWDFEARFLNICLSSLVLSQDSKDVVCFHVRQLEMPKSLLKQVTSAPLPGFFCHCTAKNKYIVLEFRTPVIGTVPYLYIPFWVCF